MNPLSKIVMGGALVLGMSGCDGSDLESKTSSELSTNNGSPPLVYGAEAEDNSEGPLIVYETNGRRIIGDNSKLNWISDPERRKRMLELSPEKYGIFSEDSPLGFKGEGDLRPYFQAIGGNTNEVPLGIYARTTRTRDRRADRLKSRENAQGPFGVLDFNGDMIADLIVGYGHKKFEDGIGRLDGVKILFVRKGSGVKGLAEQSGLTGRKRVLELKIDTEYMDSELQAEANKILTKRR